MDTRDVRNLLSQKWPHSVPHFAAAGENLFYTGVDEFNRLLPGGGLPRGQWVEITGAPGSGKTGLLFALLSGSTADAIAYLDLPRQFFPAAAVAAGLALSRLFWQAPASPGPALRAAEALLIRKGCRLVVFDTTGQGTTPWPQALVHRLRQEALRSGALVFLLSEPSQRVVPPSTVSLRVSVERRGPGCLLRVLKSRLGVEGAECTWTPGTR